MTTIPNVGTPDWQRGVISPGKLIGTVPAGTITTTVDVPPNTQSILLIYADPSVSPGTTVTGVTTGIEYVGIRRPESPISGAWAQYVYSGLINIDSQVTVAFHGAPTSTAYIYAVSYQLMLDVPEITAVSQIPNNGTHNLMLVVGGSDGVTGYQVLSTDSNGRQIPLVPTVGTLFTVAAGTTQLLAVPASGGYYLFGLDVSEAGASSAAVELIDSIGNTIAYDNPPSGGESHSIPLQGFRTTGSVSVTTTVAASIVLRYSTGP